VASGEKTGDLPHTIFRFLAYQKRFARVRDRLKSAAFYPLFLLAATFGVLLFMIFFVIPSFMQIYADAQVALPLLTRLVLSVSDIVTRVWICVLLCIGCVVWMLRRFFQTPRGRLFLDKTLLRIPLIGVLFRLSGLVNFCRTTATILASGLPLVEAMRLACGVLNNVVLQQGITDVVSSVNEGDTLGNALYRHDIFPLIAIRMIATGEKTGALGQMFEEVSEYYEVEIDNRLERLASRAEPLMLLFVGLVIGGIVVAIYLPIFQLAGTIR
jgi:type IV pilus assembly protein PilC